MTSRLAAELNAPTMTSFRLISPDMLLGCGGGDGFAGTVERASMPVRDVVVVVVI